MNPLITILIVDDERAVRRLLVRGFEGKGYRIVEASGGLDAAAKLKTAEFDFVISDVSMPKMDGMKLLAEIKESYPETCVILITGYPEDYISRELLKAGADRCFTKPFNSSDIFDYVNSLAERKRAQAINH